MLPFVLPSRLDHVPVAFLHSFLPTSLTHSSRRLLCNSVLRQSADGVANLHLSKAFYSPLFCFVWMGQSDTKTILRGMVLWGTVLNENVRRKMIPSNALPNFFSFAFARLPNRFEFFAKKNRSTRNRLITEPHDTVPHETKNVDRCPVSRTEQNSRCLHLRSAPGRKAHHSNFR